jgi:short-subunit dehydrogenase
VPLVAVTGAARGIGAETARELVQRGHRVALGDLDQTAADELAAELGGEAGAWPLDVSRSDSFAAFLAGAEERFGGPVDVLVNNAGVMWVGRFEEEPEQAARRQIEVNLLGVMHGMRLALPAMRARRSGHVINMASAASRLAPAGEATYCATKHAVLGYTTAVREELRGSGVQLSVVMPVVVDTELAVGTGTGRGRRLQPEDVARAIVDTIERPRFEVYVPRSTGAFMRALALAPQRVRDVLSRAAVPNQLEQTDPRAREEYEARVRTAAASSSRPGPAG